MAALLMWKQRRSMRQLSYSTFASQWQFSLVATRWS